MAKGSVTKKVEEKKVETPAVKKSIEKKKSEPVKKVEEEKVVVEKKKREKREKDPNAPKRPLSAYFLYTVDKRADLKAKHPDLKPTEIAKELGLLWEADKAKKDPCVAKYQAQAVKLRDAYRVEVAKYKASE